MIESNGQINHQTRLDTKDRILDAAERLFAQHGFDATSLRMITAAAEVNLASVNYHFHSKNSLIEAVLTRRIAPLNRERLDLLASIEAFAGTESLRLEDVVQAFVSPVVRKRLGNGGPGADFGRLFGRIYSDPCECARACFFGQMREILRPFTSAFRRALPSLPTVELMWRIHFGVGVMAHTLAGMEHLKHVSGGLCDLSDVEGTIDRIVTFICAGMRAPLAPAPNRS
jgi:AcrR family transcriptional regulator